MSRKIHSETFTLTIASEKTSVEVRSGETLRSALARSGIYFPQNCGGKAKCGCCRFKYHGDVPEMLPREIELLGADSPYRLACLRKVHSDLTISLPPVQEWLIDKDIASFDFAGSVRQGYGFAVDLGTTVIALYLANFSTGKIMDHISFLNPQVNFGSDVMTRLQAAKIPQHQETLTTAVRRGLADGIGIILRRQEIASEQVTSLYLVGNSPMIHLLLGRSGEGLEEAPYRSPLEKQTTLALDPSWIGLTSDCDCRISPLLEGFIGGDTTAAILAADLDYSTDPELLIDLGTNGEIVLAADGDILATSTAAGPAFEGVGMKNGMPAIKGAIEGLDESGEPYVIGGGLPVGFCGSGYISAAAYLLRKGQLHRTGLLARDSSGERRWRPVGRNSSSPAIVQDDIRKFQLAKGAVAAGIAILLREAGIEASQLQRIYITGSFGNRIDPQATITVGLIPSVSKERVNFIDNAAGRGALLCLGNEYFGGRAADLMQRVRVINLGNDPEFQDIYIEKMGFQGDDDV